MNVTFLISDARYSEELRNHAVSLFTCLQYSKHVKSNDNENNNGQAEDDSEKGPLNPELASQSSLISQDSVDSVSSASEKAGFSLVVSFF